MVGMKNAVNVGIADEEDFGILLDFVAFDVDSGDDGVSGVVKSKSENGEDNCEGVISGNLISFADEVFYDEKRHTEHDERNDS